MKDGLNPAAHEARREPAPERAPTFRPGQSGNPGGRPKGSRNKVSGAFLGALCEDFEAHGPAAIERMRKADPVAYVRLCASLLPKEMRVERSVLEEATDDELARMLALVRERHAQDG